MPSSYPPFKANFHRTLDALKDWLGRTEEEILDPARPIIDPHHHLRVDPRGRYLLEELARDVGCGHNVRGTVFVDSQHGHLSDGPEALRPVAETEFVMGLLDAARLPPSAPRLCAGLVGNISLALGAAAQEGLEAHVRAGRGRFRGIRDPLIWDAGDINYGPRRPPPDRMLDPAFREGFRRLAALGLTFDAWLFHHQLPLLTGLARDFPQAVIILDHVGAPLGVGPYTNRRAEVFTEWRAAILDLASCPNVVVKLGGLGMLFFGFDFHLRPLPPSSDELAAAWRPYVETCIEAFGPRRCMFESNFPVDIQSCSYRTLWNAFKRITAACSAAEKDALFFDTANETYKLGLTSGG